jgi:hypothetical protein
LLVLIQSQGKPLNTIAASSLNIRELGAKGDGQTDDWPIFEDAKQKLLERGGGEIFVPPGGYAMSQPFEVRGCMRMRGVGGGQAGGEASFLVAAPDQYGIIVGQIYTSGTGGANEPNIRGGDGSIIEGIAISSQGGNAPVDGIWMRARAVVRDCIINGFSRHGIRVEAYWQADPSRIGNANGWAVERCRAQNVGGDGLNVVGSDSNAGTSHLFDAAHCGGYAINDRAFLHNNHYGPQAASCSAGAFYLGLPDPNNRNARISLWGGYSESGQPPSAIYHPAECIGGLHAAGFTDDSNGIIFVEGAFLRGVGVNCGGGFLRLGGNDINGDILSFWNAHFPHGLRLRQTEQGLRLDYSNLDAEVIWQLPRMDWKY